LKLVRRKKGKREVFGKFKSYVALAEFIEKKKLWGTFYVVPTNLKRLGAIRKLTRKRGDVGVYVEKYGWV